ncbi:MAG: trans-sulfuration enzyme family protein, partial [Shewanella sp.]
PGSLIYEMQDLRKICDIAHARGIPVATDNTWGSAWYYNPMKLGVDISVIAATKYLCGHSDVTMGISVVNEKEWPNFANYPEELGQISPADDAYLVLRGMRTMGIRLEAHQKSATMIAKWLQNRPEVEKIYYPALEDHPGHDIWKRDCTGANGLFTIEFKREITPKQTDTFIDALKYFSIGASWGGYESLVLPANVQGMRTATDWSGHGIFIRLHIGLEDAEDLRADLENALNAMTA